RHEDNESCMSLDEFLPKPVVLRLRPLWQMEAGRLYDDLAPLPSELFSSCQKVVNVLLFGSLSSRVSRHAAPHLLSIPKAGRDWATEVGDSRIGKSAIPS